MEKDPIYQNFSRFKASLHQKQNSRSHHRPLYSQRNLGKSTINQNAINSVSGSSMFTARDIYDQKMGDSTINSADEVTVVVLTDKVVTKPSLLRNLSTYSNIEPLNMHQQATENLESDQSRFFCNLEWAEHKRQQNSHSDLIRGSYGNFKTTLESNLEKLKFFQERSKSKQEGFRKIICENNIYRSRYKSFIAENKNLGKNEP